MNKSAYPMTCKCNICDKKIELMDAYSPTRYEISILPNPQIAALAKSNVYKFVCEKCAEEIKQSILRMKYLKTTETQFNRLYNEVEFGVPRDKAKE